MAKIGIIDDTETDANNRYGFLNGGSHEVHVLMVGVRERERGGSVGLLETEGGFSPDRVYFDPKDMPQMDIYFCDGLRGACFEIADSVGKDRTVINSSDDGIVKIAKETGYRVLEGAISEILAKL